MVSLMSGTNVLSNARKGAGRVLLFVALLQLFVWMSYRFGGVSVAGEQNLLEWLLGINKPLAPPVSAGEIGAEANPRFARYDLLAGVNHLRERGDVVLVVKTGVATARRFQTQLETFLAPGSYWAPDNVVVIGDADFTMTVRAPPDRNGTSAGRDPASEKWRYEVVDTLKDLAEDEVLKDTAPFAIYRQQLEFLKKSGLHPLNITRGTLASSGATTARVQSVPEALAPSATQSGAAATPEPRHRHRLRREASNPVIGIDDSTAKIGAASDPQQSEQEQEPEPGERNVPTSDDAGWRLDAFKILPGYRLAYRKFPRAKWYFCIDDDTIVLTANLLRWLDLLDAPDAVPDPDLAPEAAAGESKPPFWTGGVFAGTYIHGGGGVLFSNAAFAARFGNRSPSTSAGAPPRTDTDADARANVAVTEHVEESANSQQATPGSDAALLPFFRLPLSAVAGDLTTTVAFRSIGAGPALDLGIFFGGMNALNYTISAGRACLPPLSFHHANRADALQLAADAPAAEDRVLSNVDVYLGLQAGILRRRGYSEPASEDSRGRGPKHSHADSVHHSSRHADRALLRTHAAASRTERYLDGDWPPRPLVSLASPTTSERAADRSAETCRAACVAKGTNCAAWLFNPSVGQAEEGRCLHGVEAWLSDRFLHETAGTADAADTRDGDGRHGDGDGDGDGGGGRGNVSTAAATPLVERDSANAIAGGRWLTARGGGGSLELPHNANADTHAIEHGQSTEADELERGSENGHRHDDEHDDGQGQEQGHEKEDDAIYSGLNIDTLIAWQTRCDDGRWRRFMHQRPWYVRPEYRQYAAVPGSWDA